MIGDEYYTDLTVPNRIEKFFAKYLKHTKGIHAGKPFVLLGWQKELVKELFGTRNKSNGLRRYRKGLLLIPRKNGKSTLAAGLCLYFLLFGEFGGEIYVVANTREQAGHLYRQAVDMVQMSPALSIRLRVFKHEIYDPKSKSVFKVLSREANSALGTNPSFVIVDELLTAPDDTLYNALSTGMNARKEPMILAISTAGRTRAGFLWEMVQHAEQVNAGMKDDPSFYAKLYQLRDGDDWEDEEVWKKCNPSLGHTFSIDSLRLEFRQAREFTSQRSHFKTFYLNGWNCSEDKFISDDAWEACGEDISLEDFRGETCYIGLDLASNKDLTAFTLLFARDDKFYVFSFPFCAEEAIELRSRNDKVNYKKWADEGFLTATPGNATDHEAVLNKLVELSRMFRVHGVALDIWGADMLVTRLQGEGFDTFDFRQNAANYHPALMALEKAVLTKCIAHNKNPVLRWCVSNLVLKTNVQGYSMPDKNKQREKIDCATAMLMAIGIALKDINSGPVGMPSFA